MEMATLSIAEETVTGLWQAADSLGITIEVLADKAIRRYLRQEAERKIRGEEQHLRAQHARLLDEYAGQFIAMHEGQVIDSDTDELALYLRIYQTHPMVGVLIKQVISALEEVWVMRSPHLKYD